MRLPRELSGRDLVVALAHLGCAPTRQSGSHVRVRRIEPTEHHVRIPDHTPRKLGTLSAIPRNVADENALTRDELLTRLFETR